MNSVLENSKVLEALRVRRERIDGLIKLQKVHLAAELFRAELNYVNAEIEFRERHKVSDIILK